MIRCSHLVRGNRRTIMQVITIIPLRATDDVGGCDNSVSCLSRGDGQRRRTSPFIANSSDCEDNVIGCPNRLPVCLSGCTLAPSASASAYCNRQAPSETSGYHTDGRVCRLRLTILEDVHGRTFSSHCDLFTPCPEKN